MSNRAFNSAQWNIDIKPLSEMEIKDLYEKVMSRIKKHEKYGGYDAVMYMMGQKTADLLGQNRFVNRRPISEPLEVEEEESRVGLGLKRMEREWMGEEEYVSAEMVGLQGRKRKIGRK